MAQRSGGREQLLAPGPVGESCQEEDETKLTSLLAAANESLLDHGRRYDMPEKAVGPKAALHVKRVRELASLTPPPELIFYGDSITEFFGRGENVGGSRGKTGAEDRRVFQAAFLKRFGLRTPPAVMAVSGDTAGQLLWRLRDGEAPRLVPRAILLHIGTNNLRRPEKSERELRARAENVYFAVKAVVVELWRRCRAPLVLTALLPRSNEWPEGPFGFLVPRVNQLLMEMAARTRPGELFVVDCSSAVLSSSTGRINRSLMPDFLHPSTEGNANWARCLAPTLGRILGQPIGDRELD